MKRIQMSTDWWRDKQNVLYPYNGISFHGKNEWSQWNTDSGYNMDEHAKWKKKVHKRPHMIHLNKMFRIDKSKPTENRLVVARGLGEERMESNC